MNMRNINVITALSVPGKTLSDDFIHAVLSNCTTKIVLPAPEKFGSGSLPHNFNMACRRDEEGNVDAFIFFSGAYCGCRTIRWRKICSGERTNRQNYSEI